MTRIAILVLAALASFPALLVPVEAQALLTFKHARRMAIKACEGKRQGDRVEFINRHGKRVPGVCRQEEGHLIAVRLKEE